MAKTRKKGGPSAAQIAAKKLAAKKRADWNKALKKVTDLTTKLEAAKAELKALPKPPDASK